MPFPEASKVVIEIELGNDAMGDWESVARLLNKMRKRIGTDLAGRVYPSHGFTMRDDNGNTVCRVTPE